ncbi:MAG: PucR family transcriptional regulator ligand-binding domain-containing protein [Pseudonocardia sp.]|nr:PucR family transcriptional regulator ligand-binding domain-containing protein [Pseudonocardia sp.]
MTLTLAEVLDIDAVAQAAPEVLVGADHLDRPVRWVHTSELAEAAQLLKGGELLLTCGLGIAGRGSVGEAAYIAALAERGATALALELGWTFPEATRAMIDAAREHDLPLLVLRKIVPFVEIAEQVQRALLERTAEGVERERDVRQTLTDALLGGAGPQELTGVLAELTGAPVVVTTTDGELVSAAGQPPGTRRRARPAFRRDVVLLDRLWGEVAVLPPARADDPVVVAACVAGAEALELALLRSAATGDLSDRRRLLTDDLVAGRHQGVGELVGRARVLGLSFPAESRYAALVVGGVGAADVEAAARAATGALPAGTALVTAGGDEVVVVARTSAETSAARAVLAAVDAVVGTGAPRVVAGPVVTRLDLAGRSLETARQALELAMTLEPDRRWLASAELTTPLLLARLRGDALARQLVREELRALQAHDETTGSDLVGTLRAYLAHSSSKVRTAAALRVRRQTLHARLARIEELIGDVHAAPRHTALVLALALHELGPGTSTRSEG